MVFIAFVFVNVRRFETSTIYIKRRKTIYPIKPWILWVRGALIDTVPKMDECSPYYSVLYYQMDCVKILKGPL